VGACAHRNLQGLTITEKPPRCASQRVWTVELTGTKQIHIQEGSPCPSSASHRHQRLCGAREKRVAHSLYKKIEFSFLFISWTLLVMTWLNICLDNSKLKLLKIIYFTCDWDFVYIHSIFFFFFSFHNFFFFSVKPWLISDLISWVWLVLAWSDHEIWYITSFNKYVKWLVFS
jgi:hypothetical protein